MRIQSHSLQGKRSSNEDQHVHLLNINSQNTNLNNVNFVGVFDGHGGKLVSKYLKKNLPKYFISKLDRDVYNNSRNASKYFKNVFNKIQQDLRKDHPRASNYCGSTALCGIHFKNKKNKNMLWMINVGDSRAVLCKKDNSVLQLTEDHKPNESNEKKRINQLGGKIYYDGYDWRIKDLSLSRAFGDVEATPYVSHLPQIYRYKINNNDKFIIFACDGLWDVLSNKKAVNFVLKLQQMKFKGNIAAKLAEYAILEGSYDNVTVVLLFF